MVKPPHYSRTDRRCYRSRTLRLRSENGSPPSRSFCSKRRPIQEEASLARGSRRRTAGETRIRHDPVEGIPSLPPSETTAGARPGSRLFSPAGRGEAPSARRGSGQGRPVRRSELDGLGPKPSKDSGCSDPACDAGRGRRRGRHGWLVRRLWAARFARTSPPTIASNAGSGQEDPDQGLA